MNSLLETIQGAIKMADKKTDPKIDETVNEDEIVALAEVSIPDFPTSFFHAANPDGTRSAVKLSELQDYLNSLK